MAGDWIKMRSNLWDDPRVAKLCDLTESAEAAVVGALYWLWSTADQHTEDGRMPGLTLRQIDRKAGVQGFGAALIHVGWITESDDGITILRFDEHNGESAKRRCSDAKRKANVRADADRSRTSDGQAAELLRRIAELEKEIEKEKEKNKDTKTARKRAAPAALVSVQDMEAEGVNPQHASDWLTARKVKDLPLTQTAWEQTKAEAVKAGLTIASAIQTAAGNGWAGFKASWLEPSQAPRGQAPAAITTPTSDTRGDEFLAEEDQRAAAATRPPAAILALAGKLKVSA
jgi:hypothetical protein